jgi:hypothetical protein
MKQRRSRPPQQNQIPKTGISRRPARRDHAASPATSNRESEIRNQPKSRRIIANPISNRENPPFSLPSLGSSLQRQDSSLQNLPSRFLIHGTGIRNHRKSPGINTDTISNPRLTAVVGPVIHGSFIHHPRQLPRPRRPRGKMDNSNLRFLHPGRISGGRKRGCMRSGVVRLLIVNSKIRNRG